MRNRTSIQIKILLASLLGISLMGGTASASLSSYWKERGQAFIPCGQERKVLAAEFGIWQYNCTAEQNNLLEKRLIETYGKGEQVGFGVATGYKSNLSLPMTATQSTVPVSSLLLPDNTTLTMAGIGSDKVFLTIEPGGSKVELVMCTGISGSMFTGCTRGLAFSGTSTAAVTANQKTHNASSQVIMSNAHYVYQQYADINNVNQTLDGIKTFTNFPIISSSAYIGLPTTNGQVATKYYVDNVGAGGFTSVNVSTTRGLSVDGSSPERVGINALSTGGIDFDGTGKTYVKTSSTLALETDATGVKINTSTLSSLIATTSAQGNLIPRYQSNGQLGVSASPVASTDAVSAGYVSSTYNKLRFFYATSTNFTLSGASNNAEQDFKATTTIPAGTLTTSTVLRFRVFMAAQKDSSVILTLKIKLGNSTIFSQATSNLAAVVAVGGIIDVMIHAKANNVQENSVRMWLDSGGNGAGSQPTYIWSNGSSDGGSDSAENGNTDLPLSMTATWNTTAANNTATIFDYTVEQLKSSFVN